MRKYFLLNVCLILFVSGVFSQPWQKVADFQTFFPTYLYNNSSTGTLFFTGRFIEINDSPYFGVAELKIDSFYQFGCGIGWNCVIPYTINGVYTNSIATYNAEVYVTGNFSSVSNIPAKSIAKWDGQDWVPIGSGLKTGTVSNGTGHILTEIDNELYLGGSFDSAFGMSAHSLVKYDGQNWSPVNNIPEFSPVGSPNKITKVLKYQNKLYVGGQFYSGFGVDDVNAISVFDGTEWIKVGTGIPNPNDVVSDMVVYKGELIIGGQFTKSSHPQNPGNNIAAWDGTNWHSLGDASQGYGLTGTNSFVSRMIVQGEYLYVCGRFTEAGGKPATSVARWDGTNWCALATGFIGLSNEPVYSIAFYGDTLFAVGEFNRYDGDTTIRYSAKLVNPNSHAINCTTVGIQKNTITSDFGISPNPASEVINISYVLNENSQTSLQVINSLGQTLKDISSSQQKGAHTLIIDAKQFAKGIYYFRFFDGLDSKQAKVIIQ